MDRPTWEFSACQPGEEFITGTASTTLDKKERYFKTNIETFPNSLRALKRGAWTLSDLRANHAEVLHTLQKYVA